ncbi:MAG: hypothetical protein WBD36_10320 [Bacteroidota bacterium]
MKTLNLFAACVILLSGKAIAQFHKSVDLSSTVYKTIRVSVPPNPYAYYEASSGSIGHQLFTNPTEHDVWRSLYKFDLSSIPSDAVIESATLTSVVSNYSGTDNGEVYYFTRVNLLDETVNPTSWGEPSFNLAITGSQTANHKYTDTGRTVITQTVLSRLAIGRIVFGGYSNVEDYGTSKAQLSLSITVGYYQLFPITFQNNFTAGTMGIVAPGINNPSAGVPYTKADTKLGDAFALTASAQQDPNDYDRVWNNYAPISTSNWVRQIGGGSPIQRSTSQTYSFNAEETDATAVYTANLRKNYRISRSDETEFDGNVSAGVVTQIVEQNTGSVSAPSQQTINNRDYRFSRWSDGVTSNPREYAPSDNTTLTASYKAHLASSNSAATAGNNQRKIASYSGGSKHAVYESGGSIWYTRNDGSSWTSEVGIAFGQDYNGYSLRNPSIAVTRPGGVVNVHVTWEGEDSAPWHSRISYYRRSTDNGATWGSVIPLYETYGMDATPVVAGTTTTAVVVWTGNGEILARPEPSVNTTTYSFSGADDCIMPSLAANTVFNLAYMGGSGVLY